MSTSLFNARKGGVSIGLLLGMGLMFFAFLTVAKIMIENMEPPASSSITSIASKPISELEVRDATGAYIDLFGPQSTTILVQDPHQEAIKTSRDKVSLLCVASQPGAAFSAYRQTFKSAPNFGGGIIYTAELSSLNLATDGYEATTVLCADLITQALGQ